VTKGGAEEILFLGELTRVTRRRLADGSTVIWKELLGPNALQRLRHESKILERLAGVAGVPQLHPGHSPANTIVVGDDGGRPLTTLCTEGRLAADLLLSIAAKAAGILAAVHRQGVIHKNITPDNLLVTATFEPLLIDFSLATTFAEERPAFLHHREIAGTLGYLAPEQTGRTGRGVDQRTDLYALGATLYRLATGRPPFEEQDPLQLIHDILARVPVPPAWLTPSLPQGLSEIITRLLEKEPDRRYQSAQGVAHDLERVSTALAAGKTGSMPLGEGDFALRLSPPSRLVGRDKELAALRAAFDAALAGNGSCLMACGAPGVGKSALLNELRPLVAERRGFFVSGKFDQYGRDLTSDAVFQAFTALNGLLLAEPEQELAAIRERIVQMVGPNVPLLCALVPEFALLAGMPHVPWTEQGPDWKARLIHASLDHLRAVASPERPVVMVIDDLQWGAGTPLGLFDVVLSNQPVPGLLLVGSFRDGDLDHGQPFGMLMSRWQALGVTPPLLRLENLHRDELALFLREMLRLQEGEALQLAGSVMERTGGNPYDTVELVNALRGDGALSPGQKGWSWDREAIGRYLGHGDVVNLLDVRIRRLPATAQALLEVMACLGSSVPPSFLACAAALTDNELEETLAPALEDGMVVAGERGLLRFRHDRVQQAAYARLMPEQKTTRHLAVARRLAARPEFETLAAEQYLPALEALHDAEERREVIALFRRGAARLLGVNAQQSERFLCAALQLLEVPERPCDARLRVALESARHATLYVLGRLEEGDLLFSRIEELAGSPLELAEVGTVQICALTSRGRNLEAVSLGLRLLGELGVPVPSGEALEAENAQGLAAYYRWLESDGLAADFQRAELTEPVPLAAARLMNRIIPPAYFTNQAMISWWLVLQSRQLWAEHGPCPALAGPLGHLAFATISLDHDFRRGGLGVRHVLAVSEARGWELEAAQVRFLSSMTVTPWHRPLQESVQQSLRAEEGLLQGGDPLNACFTYYASIPQLLDCAPTLDDFACEVDRAIAFASRTGNSHVLDSIYPYRELVTTLRGGSADSPPGRGLAGGISHLTRGIVAAILGNAAELAGHAAGVDEAFSFLQGNFLTAQGEILSMLSLALQLREAGSASTLARFNQRRLFLAARESDASDNFLHLLRWLDAERAWGTGELQEALVAFDAALDLLEGVERPWHRAIICERAARCQLEAGLGHQGKLTMVEARRLYHEWGATVKVKQLDAEFPFLRQPRRQEWQQGEQPASVSADAIDLLAVLRASQALSSETSLERLTDVVVKLVGTMTGATSVALVVRGGGEEQWQLLTPGEKGQLPLEQAAQEGMIPLALFHYAQRTGAPVVVDDAVRDDRFNHDRHFAGYTCCSALAVPITSHGSTEALLLLENVLCRGAFTADVLGAVTLIAGQLAVSLENALLYQRLEERVSERTRELREAQQELVTAARHAGRAEIASNVLHNVGNVLNSVNVSAELIMNRLKSPRVTGVAKAAELLKNRSGDLRDFLVNDEQGRLIPAYLEKLSKALAAEQQELVAEVSRLTSSVHHIKEIVATQQCYAGAGSLIEPVLVPELVDDALRINLGSLSRQRMEVVREYGELPPLTLDKGRLLQILVNLVANARQAMKATETPKLVVRVEMTAAGRLRVTVADSGEGIAAEHLSRIFGHGFTTRKDGHGFGLHSCALAAREMGGTLVAKSEGSGRGASFVLELPVQGQGGEYGTAS
jgi:predicted ATPase/signal transduction histidine kinase